MKPSGKALMECLLFAIYVLIQLYYIHEEGKKQKLN